MKLYFYSYRICHKNSYEELNNGYGTVTVIDPNEIDLNEVTDYIWNRIRESLGNVYDNHNMHLIALNPL